MDAKSARTLSRLAVKAKTKERLAPILKQIEKEACAAKFYADFFYGENVETYSLVHNHKKFLEKMGYTVTFYQTAHTGKMYQIEW